MIAYSFEDVDRTLENLAQCVTVVKEGLAFNIATLRKQHQSEEEALLLQLQQLRECHAAQLAQLEADAVPRITAYEREARQLRVSRNTLAPACCLPPEILCSIFVELRHIWHLWTRATHVCRRWREVALECGPLWASVSTRQSPREVAAFLERSGGASLHAHLDLWDRKLSAIQHINGSMERIQSLDVDVAASFMQGAHSHLFSNPAWGLETLFASTDSRLSHDNRIEFPTTMFNAQAPRLRRVSLRGCWFPPQWPPLAQLNELAIEGHHPLSLCDVRELAELLERTPNLVALKLGGVLHSSRTEDLEPPNKVKLPRLALLGVSDSVQSFMQIWDTLSIPASTSLTISVHRDEFGEYRDVIDAVATHLRRRSVAGDFVDQISVFASTWSVVVTAEGCRQPTVQDIGAKNNKGAPMLRLNICEEKDGAVVTRFVGSVFETFPLNRVRSARFDVDEIEWRFVSPVAISTALWVDMLARAPALTRLTLRVVLLCDVLDALASVTSTNDQGETSSRRLVPFLQELQLQNVHFAATDRAPESSANNWMNRRDTAGLSPRPVTNGEALKTWLNARHSNPNDSLRLVLSKCRGLTPQLLDDLQQVAHSVEWNSAE